MEIKYLDRQPSETSARIRHAKERIFGAVTVMDDVAASKLWNYISDNFSDAEASWDSIPEVEPDEFDLKMLKERNRPGLSGVHLCALTVSGPFRTVRKQPS